MTPEQKARVSIDALLVAAGWHVCHVADADIRASSSVAISLPSKDTQFRVVAEVDRRLPIAHKFEAEVDANPMRLLALWRTILARTIQT
jgi:hypothetical protein